ncbi:Crp/Fnr family transcriptional regulator [Dissulfurirhabdus thermomarina]|uniref:Crp/Fnr family transcriptional regulator n=2 Tax=Dissulfurirhabdus thermomarina TaxID=1765737 RepID=A0A6N9TP21_DISTH|nr:Crp/Fnr family transcriptional regulator [Dissulfurirhabdus thermomarina]NMX23879.1 Crp/Fnr family transcriptional regulator [Dissulfurirhabdus thermomarina]
MIAVEHSVPAGAAVFSEGDEGTGFYVVLEGRVKIFKLSAEGREQILHLFGPGDPFGEAAVFAGRHFPANAVALAPSRLLFFPRAAFVDLVTRRPSLALGMLAVLSRRLHRFARLIEDLSLREVPGRLAAYLLALPGAGSAAPVVLEIPKAQIAGLLGTTPETLSRILRKMSDRGLVRVDGPRIRILDRPALEDLAAGETRLA